MLLNFTEFVLFNDFSIYCTFSLKMKSKFISGVPPTRKLRPAIAECKLQMMISLEI